MPAECAVGLDLGATRLRVCVGGRDGRILWKNSELLSVPKMVEGYVDHVVGAVREAVRHVPGSTKLVGIGVASAGPLDLKKGVVKPANLPYESIPLVEPLEEALGLRVSLMNDANAAALGERNFGAGKGRENLVYVTISTGIGGGAIVDGHLLVGKDGNAAEIGHVVVDPAERLTCGCGGKGHWEAYCSGRGIPRLASLLAEEVPKGRADGPLRRILGRALEEQAAAIMKASSGAGPLGKRLVEEMGRLNAIGFANVVNVFDPSLITVGGGVALNNRELVMGPIRRLVPAYAVNRVPDIIITPLGDKAGLLGALSLAFGI